LSLGRLAAGEPAAIQALLKEEDETALGAQPPRESIEALTLVVFDEAL